MATPKKKTQASKEPAPKSSAKSSNGSAKGASSNAASGTRASKGAGSKTVAVPEPKPEPKPKPPLDKDLVEEIKVELLKKKHELGSNVSNELDDMREAAEGHHLADMDDLGGDAHDEETQYKILEIESAELDQIDQALDRIVSGSFGYCEVCEKPISADRLRALPFTNLCINCKRLQEQNES
ncbi:MAG TPA: TraR/DksA C4-type zinc finger protein [Planctomycetota bacterium]|nr:TraR/DksA C4-type zinc finger protein [Planctomycetota bacterium]